MANGAWSNDQLNSIFIYDAQTGQLIMRVDENGIYYYNVANGSYFAVGTGIGSSLPNQVAALWYPGPSSLPGVTFEFPAEVVSAELVSGGQSFPVMVLSSPNVTGKTWAQIDLAGTPSGTSGDASQIGFNAAFLFGKFENQIGQGTSDEGGGGTAGYTSANFTTTEIAADYTDERYGTYSTTRRYYMQWSGTVQSSTAGDRIGLRMYTGPNKSNLTGATQIRDYGQITIAAANIPQPFHVAAPFNGIPGQFGLLGARRVSGSGTCFLTFNYRLCQDTIGSYT